MFFRRCEYEPQFYWHGRYLNLTVTNRLFQTFKHGNVKRKIIFTGCVVNKITYYSFYNTFYIVHLSPIFLIHIHLSPSPSVTTPLPPINVVVCFGKSFTVILQHWIREGEGEGGVFVKCSEFYTSHHYCQKMSCWVNVSTTFDTYCRSGINLRP